MSYYQVKTVEDALHRIEEYAALVASVAHLAATDDEQAMTANAFYGMAKMCDEVEELAHDVCAAMMQSKSVWALELPKTDAGEADADEDGRENGDRSEERDEDGEHEETKVPTTNAVNKTKELTEAVAALREAV